MERAREFLEPAQEHSEIVSRLVIHPHRVGVEASFYEDFALWGIRVDRVEPGFVACTFKVPPRLTDRDGNFASGAIVNLVDLVAGSAVYIEGLPLKVSVDMSVCFASTAKVNEELEITARVLGERGGYSGTIVILRNKASGDIIAEGRHSLFVYNSLCVNGKWSLFRSLLWIGVQVNESERKKEVKLINIIDASCTRYFEVDNLEVI